VRKGCNYFPHGASPDYLVVHEIVAEFNYAKAAYVSTANLKLMFPVRASFMEQSMATHLPGFRKDVRIAPLSRRLNSDLGHRGLIELGLWRSRGPGTMR